MTLHQRYHRNTTNMMNSKLLLFSLASMFSCGSGFLSSRTTSSTSSSLPLSSSLVGGSQQFMMVKLNGSGESEVVETTSSSSDAASSDEDDLFPHAYIAEQTRKDFDILLNTKIGNDDNDKNDLIYLDSAATSQKPRQVMDALENYYMKLNSNVHRGAHTLSRDATAAYEKSRDTITQFINAKSRNEIIFTSGATESLNLIASTFGQQNINADDGNNQIIITEMEHHSNIVPWQLLVEQKTWNHPNKKDNNKIIQYVKLNKETGALDMEHLESLLTPQTKIVSLHHVSNVCGCINPINDIAKMIRSKSPNAKIIIDACQSIPHMKVDVQELDIDFLAASGHKMCGPTGIGFLWGKEDLLNSIPPFMGGGEMIDTVTLDSSTYAKSPGRFEAGTPPIAQAVGLGAAIDYLNNIGMDNIEAYEHELSNYLYEQLSQVDGVSILGPKLNGDNNRAALCAFVCDQVHPSDLSSFLDMEGVAIRAGHHCCQPLHNAYGYSHSARASLYFYNTKEEIDTFIVKLKETINFFSNLDGSNANEESNNDADEEEFVPFI